MTRALEKNPRLRLSSQQFAQELHTLRSSEKLPISEKRAETAPEGTVVRGMERFWRRAATLPPSRIRRLATMTLISVASISGLAAGVYAFRPQAPAPPKVKSIAVIPLYNESLLPGFDFFGHGLGAKLAEGLAALDGLLVLPYRQKLYAGDDAEDIANQLGVEAVIEGGFSVNGGQVDVHVDLVTRDGKREHIPPIHSDSYNHAVVDLVSVVSRHLKSRLTPTEAARVATAPSKNNGALEALMRAQEAHQRGDRDTALNWYEQALSLDPGLAQAYVGIGAIYYDRYFRGKAPAINLSIADAQFRQALAINPDEGGALRGRILVFYERGERDSALVLGRQASQRLSNPIDALTVPAWAYLLSGMPDLAVPLVEQAGRIDSESDEIAWIRVVANAWAGRSTETTQAAEAFLSRFGEDPEIYVWDAAAWEDLGDWRRASALFRRAIELFGDDSQLYVSLYAGYHFRAHGDELTARKVFEDAVEIGERRKLAAEDNLRLRSILLGLYSALHDEDRVESEARYILGSLGAGRPGIDPSAILAAALYAGPKSHRAVVRLFQALGPENGLLLTAHAVGLPIVMRRTLASEFEAMKADPALRPILLASESYDRKLRAEYAPAP